MDSRRPTTHALVGLSILAMIVLAWNILLVDASSSSASSASSSSSLEADQEETCEDTSNGNTPSTAIPQPIPHPNEPSLWWYPYESTSSTQDEAKRLVASLPSTATTKNNHHDESSRMKSFCITTTEQTNGRGTSGRQWMGRPGNVFVTMGWPMSAWTHRKIPLTLLPLKIGSLVAQHIQDHLARCKGSHPSGSPDSPPPKITVKWPNDVLVDQRKVAGVLIESATSSSSSSSGSETFFLIGIGVNLEYAPPIPTSGPNHGRPSTALQDYCQNDQDHDTQPQSLQTKKASADAHQFGLDIAHALHQFVYDTTSSSNDDDVATTILEEWKAWLDWEMELVMRDTPERERVKLTDVLPDGRIRVVPVDSDNSKPRVLVSDYFV